MTRHISPGFIACSVLVGFGYLLLRVLDYLGHHVAWLPWY